MWSFKAFLGVLHTKIVILRTSGIGLIRIDNLGHKCGLLKIRNLSLDKTYGRIVVFFSVRILEAAGKL